MTDRNAANDYSSSAKAQLIDKVKKLDDEACAVLETLVDALECQVTEDISSNTDIVTSRFARNFRVRLQLHHATNEEVFKKKSFEYAFKAASIAAGHTAEVDVNSTRAGHDVTVDNVRFSLKTEAAKSIRKTHIKISKFSEARFIRECATKDDFCKGVQRVLTHLSHYDRIITLRAFKTEQPAKAVCYDLVEIPRQVLERVKDLRPENFGLRTKNGGNAAWVEVEGERWFKLRFDGSVEKIIIESLDSRLCRLHASWRVPILIDDGKDADDEDNGENQDD